MAMQGCAIVIGRMGKASCAGLLCSIILTAIPAAAQKIPEPPRPQHERLSPNVRPLPTPATDLKVPQRIWRATPLDATAFPRDIEADSRLPAPGDALPDGLIATAPRGEIAAAWYTAPATRYGHAILGDGIEAGGVRIRTRAGDVLDYTLPDSEVFEDRYPRLADLDADGTIEIVTIRASLREGAAITVYGLRDGKIRHLATTAFIGTPNRWLNIAGIARFRGGPGQEIAHVRTPHIGGTLMFHAYERGRLVLVARQFGFSNHAIALRKCACRRSLT